MITAVDRPERIERVLGAVREMAPNALITVHEVEVIQSGVPFREGLPDVKISEVMRREVVTVYPESAVTEVVQLLLDKDFTAVPVVDDSGKLVGMVSDNDLLKRGGSRVTLSLKRAADPDFVQELHKLLKDPGRKVCDVMTREVVTIKPDTIMGQAAKLMVAKHLKRLPIVDKKEGKARWYPGPAVHTQYDCGSASSGNGTPKSVPQVRLLSLPT